MNLSFFMRMRISASFLLSWLRLSRTMETASVLLSERMQGYRHHPSTGPQKQQLGHLVPGLPTMTSGVRVITHVRIMKMFS